MSHTPEPWNDKTPKEIGGSLVVISLSDWEKAKSCVNACAGINPEAVQMFYEALKYSEECDTGSPDAILHFRELRNKSLAKAREGGGGVNAMDLNKVRKIQDNLQKSRDKNKELWRENKELQSNITSQSKRINKLEEINNKLADEVLRLGGTIHGGGK